jgi:tetratricopeptide (TPR) repeat protein
VTKESDLAILAQLYLYHGAPIKGAKILASAIAQGNLVADEKNLSLLASAYLQAKETDDAIKALRNVSEISASGKHEALLAQTYLNDEQWQFAIDAAKSALVRFDNEEDKVNKVKDIANMHLAIGMANFNLKKFESSLAAFAKAAKFASTQKAAIQWGKYVEREQQNYKIQLAMLN